MKEDSLSLAGQDHLAAQGKQSKQALRAWLHLLKCSKRVEQVMNDHFRTGYDCSLSRFDVLAQLDHAGPGGLSTKALAQRLVASKGNITRLIDRMESDGLLRRTPCKQDRRVSHIDMTNSGEAVFQAMAGDHETWASQLFDELSDDELETLVRLLDRVRDNVTRRQKEQLAEEQREHRNRA
ncbi:MAG: MarR family transcriptional regulator [Ectothiorhodospiraceae bacterium]|nr:MarR family transcriptional regulator [Ectothiorhodospiraceae bacterium]MCH8503660.1 MarR family transcriptional regulator [Ectothiorhodospiraceae bacterium]